MKRRKAVGTMILIGVMLFTGQVAANPFTDHPVFSKLIGKWTGKGELKTAEGDVVTLKESWEGKPETDGTFSAKGTRKMNDEDQEFRWIYSYNANTELYECEYWHTGMEDPVRFEIVITGDSKMALQAPFGSPGTELKMTSTVKKDKIVGEVKLSSDAGIDLLKGSVTHVPAKE